MLNSYSIWKFIILSNLFNLFIVSNNILVKISSFFFKLFVWPQIITIIIIGRDCSSALLLSLFSLLAVLPFAYNINDLDFNIIFYYFMNYFLNDPHTRAWILKICLILFNLLRKLPQSIDSKLNKYCQNVVVFLFKKTVLLIFN